MTITPTQPPTLPTDVFRVGRPTVTVIGAATPLGRAVVDELQRSHVPSRGVVADHAGPAADETYQADVSTGGGLDEALEQTHVVVHCADSSPTFPDADVRAARNLVSAMQAWAPQAHLIVPSHIGAWNNPHSYFRTRAEVENIVAERGGMTSVIRTSISHDQLFTLLHSRRARGLVRTPNVRICPTDLHWLAQKIVDIALMRSHLPLPMEAAGPEVMTLDEAATLHDRLLRGARRRGLALPTGSASGRALAAGVHLPSPDALRGGRSYSQWLAAWQLPAAG